VDALFCEEPGQLSQDPVLELLHQHPSLLLASYSSHLHLHWAESRQTGVGTMDIFGKEGGFSIFISCFLGVSFRLFERLYCITHINLKGKGEGKRERASSVGSADVNGAYASGLHLV
jgi:hypothetical protein